MIQYSLIRATLCICLLSWLTTFVPTALKNASDTEPTKTLLGGLVAMSAEDGEDEGELDPDPETTP